MRKRLSGHALLLIALGLAACGRQPHLPGDEVVEEGVVVLEPWDTARFTQSTDRVIALALPQAERAPLARFDRVFAQALRRRQVVLIPHLDSLPAEVWGPLHDYLEAGGGAVLWGAQPFAQRVWTAPAGMESERALTARLAADAAPPGWPEAQSWRLVSEPARPGLVLRVARDPALPWPGVQAEVTSTVAWAGLTADFPAAPINDPAAILVYACGGARVPRLQFELGDGSGRWWAARIPVSPEWVPHLLPRAAFNGSGPLPAWSNLVALRVGVPARAPEVPDAPYVFGVSDVRMVRDPRPAWPMTPCWPGLPLADETFALDARRVELADGAALSLEAVTVAARPEPARCGPAEAGAARRLIPVARAVGGSPDHTGVCAHVHADWRTGSPPRTYAWLGLEAGVVEDRVLRPVLRGLISRLQHGHVILEGGLGAATVREGQPLVVRYRHVPDLRRGGHAVRLNAELLEPGGRVVRRVSATPRGPELQQLDFGRAPGAEGGTAEFTLRLRIIDTLNTTIRDEVIQPLRVVSARDHVPPRRPVEANGSLLAEAGRPLFPLIQAWDAPAQGQRVLAADAYPAARVADWLDRSRELGLNAVSFTVDDAALLPQYEHLSGELESRRMFALVHLPVFPVLHTDWTAARALVAALARQRTDPVLAFDLAAAPPRDPAHDPAWIAAWRRWLAEQFGSPAAAALALGRSGPESVLAAWSEPAGADAALTRARRRCRTDVTGRHLAAVRALLREHGLLHALTLGGPAGPEDVDPAEVAAQLDVLTLAAAPREDLGAEGQAAFLTAWTRGLSAGKPVLWREGGPAVPAQAGELALADQARRWGVFLRLLRQTAAAGGWLAPTDDGSPPFLRADGQWRPGADVVRAFSHQLRSAPPVQAAPWRDRVVDPWAEAVGASALAARWADRYGPEWSAGELVELRPLGFGVETRRLDPQPLVAAGPCVPWRELNAQWTMVRVNGVAVWRAPGAVLAVRRRDRVQLTVCNTGTATWVPWTGAASGERSVRVAVSDGASERETLRAPRLGMGQSGVVEWIPAESGDRTLRLSLPSTGSWGESLSVRIADGDP